MGQTTPTVVAKRNMRSFTYCLPLISVYRSKKKRVADEQIETSRTKTHKERVCYTNLKMKPVVYGATIGLALYFHKLVITLL